jgi:serine/threonine-protein kinase
VNTPNQARFCSACGTLLTETGFCYKCGASTPVDSATVRIAAANDPTDVATFTQIGRFKLLSAIGSGGFATVYLAEDVELGRQVAVKLLHPHLIADTDFIGRFREEARAAARLRHRNIVRIFDASQTEDGRPFLVMELLEGTLLSDIISRRAPLSLPETASIVAQLASALDYLHEHALIHRDLKPSNVMIDGRGQATLMDFGVARSVLEQSRFTSTGQLFGTPTYMAPELASGGALGPGTDIYSLGIVAYEMLAGRPPFEGNTQRLLYSHIYEQPPPLTNVSAEIAGAVQRALAKEPGLRFPTASEFAAKLAGPLSQSAADLTDTTIALPLAAADALRPPPDRTIELLGSSNAVGAADDAPTLVQPSPPQFDPTVAVQRPETLRPAARDRSLTDAAIILPPGAASAVPPEQEPDKTLVGQTPNQPPEIRPASPSSTMSGRQPLLVAAGAVLAVIALAVLAFVAIRAMSSRHTVTGKAPLAPAATVPVRAAGASAPVPAGSIGLKITSPADGAAVNSAVTIAAEQSGAVIKAATDGDPNAAHFHYFIDRDPASVLRPGQPIPSGQPDIIHSADATYTAADLRPGQHTVWVVLAHTDHTPFSPDVESKVTFTVVPAADTVQTLAGNGTKGFADGPASSAQFNAPNGVAVDAAGNVYVADSGNSRVRKVTGGNTVSTLAGAGQLDSPRGVAVDRSGNLYVTDTVNNRVRKITPDGTVTTLAGSDSPGLGGGGLADGQGTAAQFRSPIGIAVDQAGNVYVADTGNNRIRKITADGRVSTMAGSGDAGSGGFADGPAASARFNAPRGVAVDSSGNVYVADTLNERIRKINPSGMVSTIAGSGDQGNANGAASAARFSNPDGIAVDASGNIVVSDNSSFRIREILAGGDVVDVAGTKEGFADGNPATTQFDFPAGIAVDGSGNIYVADSNNNRIRKILPFKPSR